MNHCDECGYTYTTPRGDIPDRFPLLAATYAAILTARPADDLRAHTHDGVWSPLEYACHLRDVLRVQQERIERTQIEECPDFASMRRDERVSEERYNEQSPARVAAEINEAAGALAATLRGLDEHGWSRTGVYHWPVTEVRDVVWIGNHTIHECLHHLMDIERLLSDVRRG